jgi:hypothetical protein
MILRHTVIRIVFFVYCLMPGSVAQAMKTSHLLA